MSAEDKPSYAPNLKFSHMGFATTNLAEMEDFYTRVLGFTVTDRGEVMGGMKLVFLSRDPEEHHQLVLVSGRPENLPENPYHPQFGSVINQISFKVASLEEGLRFAFEVSPKTCYEMNGGKLPFGCHAWAKYDPEFWKAHLVPEETPAHSRAS